MKRIVAAILSIGAILAVVAVIHRYSQGREAIYINEALGFQMGFPSHWKGQFTVKAGTDPTQLELNSSQNDIGTLAYIIKYKQEDWKPDTVGTAYQILGQNNSSVYVLLYPGDVQWNPENKRAEENYHELREDLEQENYVFSLIG